ncbi:MAG: hypothetical protein D6766_10515, partial [Verrucomicrobia bacterium]
MVHEGDVVAGRPDAARVLRSFFRRPGGPVAHDQRDRSRAWTLLAAVMNKKFLSPWFGGLLALALAG